MQTIEDFTKIKFYYWHEEEEEDRIESMWASQEGEYFKLENIPFYVLEFAYGDIISVKDNDGELYVDELVKESGHSTIRVVFFDKSIVAKKKDELKLMGCDSEISDKSFLIAIDVPPSVSYPNLVKPYLENGAANDLWDYEEACISTSQNEESQ